MVATGLLKENVMKTIKKPGTKSVVKPTASTKTVVKTKPTTPVAEPVAATPVVKVEKTAKAEKPAKPVVPSKNKGVRTGMRIMAYQDHTLVQQATRKLSDAALAKDWQTEFPNARCQFNESTVAGVRRLFNAGKHGSQQLTAPKGGVLRYDEKGNAIAEKTRAKKTTTADKAA